jgi:hypothetical protein
MRPWAMRVIISRMRRQIGQGIHGFSSLPSTRGVGTPKNMRGISNTGERAAMVAEAVTVQMSDAMSHALLPAPTTSTCLPLKGSGTC